MVSFEVKYVWFVVNGLKLAKPLALHGLCKTTISDCRSAYELLDFIRAGLSSSGRGETFLRVERHTQTLKMSRCVFNFSPVREPGLKTIPKNSYNRWRQDVTTTAWVSRTTGSQQNIFDTSWNGGRINPHWFRELISEGQRDKGRQKRLIDRVACSC